MNTPAGWYDDGSGRMRWWDGRQWTPNYAPTSAPTSVTTPPGAAAHPTPHAGAAAAPQQRSTLGVLALGLAGLGTVLACIPTPATFGVGVLVLLVAFVLALIAVLTKGASKTPAVLGLVLSIVGGLAGLIVLAWSLSDDPAPNRQTAPATSAPSDPQTSDPSNKRPTAQEVADGFEKMVLADPVFRYNKSPEFYLCMGEGLVASDLSLETLQQIAEGVDVTTPERDRGIDIATDIGLECDEKTWKPSAR